MVKVLPTASVLCGNWARGRAAVMPDGQVTPCVLGRFLPAGDVKTQGLAAVFASPKWAEVAAVIPARTRSGCTPDEDSCMPSPGAAKGACTPADSNDCDPANTEACDPAY
ncbi:SPASM domain-containing protein [Streptomyces cinnabarinus]|uniref:SPASM domain-containing protein n=1 Tax=Streptomyces cinnabarinus TaxID=67287 RepID=A0ABY7KSL3_9ACTN|nr:SPASM domain-containing protein [Streptomyces cinnabarinus]WAZ26585.1 SPASM domain-containing protein [Streptomyces cinnabarinus]